MNGKNWNLFQWKSMDEFLDGGCSWIMEFLEYRQQNSNFFVVRVDNFSPFTDYCE